MNALLDHVHEVYWPTIQVIWPALLAAGALAIAGSIVGVFVILRRETLFALALPQVVTLGAAIALRNSWPTLPPALASVAIASAWVALARQSGRGHLALPVVYLAGLALSVLVVANAGAHLIEVQNLFVGIDVAVDVPESLIATAVLLLVAIICASLWRIWLLWSQAPAVAEIAGRRAHCWELLFLILLAAVSVMATSTLGTVMAIAMLFLPAAIALPLARRIPTALFAACICGLTMLAIGFIVSVEMTWPLSHSVAGVGVVGAFITQTSAALRTPRSL